MQLYSEGIQYELKGMMDKAIDRYIAARLRADGEIKDLIHGKLDHIAILQIEKAELLSSQGKAEQAIKLMENIAHFSKEARDKIPYFKARQLMQEAEKALKFGFYSKSLDLLDLTLFSVPLPHSEPKTNSLQVSSPLTNPAFVI